MTSTAQLTDDHQTTEFYLFMRASHESLAQLGEGVMLSLVADVRPQLHERWCELESKLLSHLEAEERYVLPAFARVDREEAFALIREHGKIRELLLELGISIELHYARLAPFQKFVEILRTHAAREEALLYRWAATMLDQRLTTAATKHANGR
jgi:hemerythrin superfamily protein